VLFKLSQSKRCFPKLHSAKLANICYSCHNVYKSFYSKVRHTSKKRTADSAHAFLSGLFPNEDVIISPALDEDKVLRVSKIIKLTFKV